MGMLERLNACNDVEIIDVHDAGFASFGRIVEGFDFSSLFAFMNEKTPIPSEGNIYIASDAEMESYPIKKQIEQTLYGGMPVQIGYCNGVNSTYNGFEFHKGSEINAAVTDFMLVLAHRWQIKDNTIHADDATVFYVPAGTVIEMYQTTLHLSPCRVTDEGFKDIVILPKGTNTPLSAEEKEAIAKSCDSESELLLQRNKWVLAHPEREPLIRQGAHPGMLGENKQLYYDGGEE